MIKIVEIDRIDRSARQTPCEVIKLEKCDKNSTLIGDFTNENTNNKRFHFK